MKYIKIIITTVLLMGLASAFAQQTDTGVQQSNPVAETEQLSPTVFSEDQPPVLQPGEQSSVLPTPSLETQAVVNTLPEEPVVSTSPEDPHQSEIPVTTIIEPTGTESQEYTGPSEDRDPNEVKPIEK